MQAVGRALRLDGDRDKTAYIFVPVLLEPGQDPVSALQSSAYGPVWRVVSALAAHDETLSEELDIRRRALGRSNGRSGNNPLSAMPDWLQFSGVPVPEQFARAITVHAVRSTTASWEEHLGAAAAYSEKHGDLLAPVTTSPNQDCHWGSGSARPATSTRTKPSHRHVYPSSTR